MKKCLLIFLIYCVSLTITSCGDEKEEYSATGTTNNTTTDNTTTDNTTTTTDTTAPTVLSISPTDNQSGVSISDNILVTFFRSNGHNFGHNQLLKYNLFWFITVIFW